MCIRAFRVEFHQDAPLSQRNTHFSIPAFSPHRAFRAQAFLAVCVCVSSARARVILTALDSRNLSVAFFAARAVTSISSLFFFFFFSLSRFVFLSPGGLPTEPRRRLLARYIILTGPERLLVEIHYSCRPHKRKGRARDSSPD